jgi:hypothetical protein
MQFKGALFPLRSAWSLRLASLAHGQIVESQSGETPEPPVSAALGMAFFGVRASWIAAVGGETQTPCLRYARFGRLRRACELNCRSRGRPPNPISAALDLAAALGLAFFGVRAS